MRWVRAAGVAVALAVVAQVAQARVPAFVRQTGLVCNQCHVSWTPVMDFTFTGMKFRLNGFRTPWVSEKVEAGDEGAVSGQRLVLSLGSMLSWHVRGLFVGGTTPASDPSTPAPSAGSPSSQLIQTVGMHYAGPIGEHIGIWNEFYMYGGGLGPTAANGNQGGARNGYIGLSHFSVVLSTNSGGNIFGWEGQLLPSPGAHDFMQLNNDPTPTHMFNNPGISGSGAPYVYYSVYGFFRDRLGVEIGLEPGEDNLDWKRFNYRVESGYFLKNTDANFWRVSAEFKMGNDMVPILSTLRASNDGVRTLVPADAVIGVSATRGGAPLSSLNMGDGKRWLFGIAGGFIDHGPHSFDISVSQSVESERYNDNSSSDLKAIGGEVRYYYNRTWGIQAQVSKYEDWKYTDAAGTAYNIPSNVAWNVTATRRIAMNYAFYLNYGVQAPPALSVLYRNGKSWGLYMQYLW